MNSNTHFTAGFFVLVALFLFVASIWLLGQERQLFAPQVEYYTKFKDVRGLSEGAPVRLSGITIGRVADIGFSRDLSDVNLHVTLLVNAGYQDRIRRDTTVSILTQGLLGDKYLSMTSGTGAQKINPGSHIRSMEAGSLGEMLDKAGEVVDTTVEISRNINEFLSDFRKETLVELDKGVKNFAELLAEINEGSGLLHRLIYSESEGVKILEKLEGTADNLNDASRQLRSGEGLLHALLYEKEGGDSLGALTAAARSLNETAGRINEIAAEIKTGEGLLHQLVYKSSPGGFEEILGKLSETAANLERASAALAKGQGTLGALLIDSKLYDNLVEVTDGAKRSFLLRQAIRKSMKKN